MAATSDDRRRSRWKQLAVHTLDRASLSLLEQVEGAGMLRLDLLAKNWPGGAPALKKSRRALENRGLVVGGDVHTETGAHAQMLHSWQTIRDRTQTRPDINISMEEAVRELKRIVGGNRLAVEVA